MPREDMTGAGAAPLRPPETVLPADPVRRHRPEQVLDTVVGDLVRASGAGDRQAWQALVERFAGLVWSIARGYRLSDADAADVSQTTWLKLVENLERIRDPERVGAWLATTARRESLRVLRRASRETATEEMDREPGLGVVAAPSPEQIVLQEASRVLLWEALQQVPERCQRLLRVLMSSPQPSYQDVSAALGLPVGSIGPTRQRCLGHLRTQLAGIGIIQEG